MKDTAVPLEMEKLTEGSKEFARWLFEWKPEWRALACMEIVEEESKDLYSLRVDLVPPSGDTARTLQLAMAQGPSIFWERWHSHMELFGEIGEDGMVEFKQCILDILSDRMVLAYEADLQWPDLLDIEDSEKVLEYLTNPRNNEKLRIVSFTGSRDGELTLASYQAKNK